MNSLRENRWVTLRLGSRDQPSSNKVRVRIMRAHLLLIGLLLLAGGCASATTHSADPVANYKAVFGDVSAPQPTVIHSRVETEHRSILGVFPLRSQYNGNWEFELVASRAWVDQVKKGFTQIPFADVSLRQLPDWFSPPSCGFTAWKKQATSYPNAHLFIERHPPCQEQIRVFICRH